jgi:hypothetical protein
MNSYYAPLYVHVDWLVLTRQLFLLLVVAVVALAAVRLARRRMSTTRRAAVVRLCLTLVVYLAVAAQALTTLAFDFGFHGDDPRLGLEAMLAGNAIRPFAYRRLSVDLIRAGGALAERRLSERTLNKLEHNSAVRRFAFQGDTNRQFRSPGDTVPTYAVPAESWNRRKAIDFHTAYAFEFLCCFATLWVARALVRALTPDAPLFADVAPAVGMILWLYVRPWLIYDASELLLLTASALALVRRRIWVHLPLFLLAVFNKESGLLLAPIALVALYGQIPRRRWTLAGVAHGIGGLTILLTVRAAYARNGGGTVQWHWADNVMFWSNIRDYFGVADTFAPLIRGPSGANPLLVLPAAALVAAGWPAAPVVVRRMLVTSLALTLPLLLAFSYRDEMRNLSIAFPALFAVGCFGVRRLYESPVTAAAGGG